MTYPFVPSANDLGQASGPRAAMTWHMAEGGGTVGYLSRPNPNGVSVHFVVTTSGDVTQMLALGHMQTSIRPSAIRGTDDPPFTIDGETVTYGATAAKAVLGTWWKNPNNASIGVEVEGFAHAGPNAAQRAAMTALWADMLGHFPGIRSLGHRDFADYKACPGKKIHWPELGGHGPATTDTAGDDVRFINSDGYGVQSGKLLPVAKNTAWQTLDGKAGGTFSADAKVPVVGRVDAHTGQYAVLLNTGSGAIYPDNVTRPTIVLVPSTAVLLDAPAPGPITPAAATVLVPGMYEVKQP